MTTSPVTTETWQAETQRIADSVRLRVLDHVLKNNGGYMSQACSSAETFSALYTKIMKLGPSIAPSVPPPFSGAPSASNPNYFTGAGYNGAKSPEMDRFIFSPAHYALVLYAVLIETGRMSAEGLEQFNKDGSTVEMIGAEHSPGCEVTSGSWRRRSVRRRALRSPANNAAKWDGFGYICRTANFRRDKPGRRSK